MGRSKRSRKRHGLALLFGAQVFLVSGCSLPLKVIDTAATTLTKTATATIQTTGEVLKTGAGVAGNAATKVGGLAPLAAALAAQPAEPSLVP